MNCGSTFTFPVPGKGLACTTSLNVTAAATPPLVKMFGLALAVLPRKMLLVTVSVAEALTLWMAPPAVPDAVPMAVLLTNVQLTIVAADCEL
jgi:hypothetical protein